MSSHCHHRPMTTRILAPALLLCGVLAASAAHAQTTISVSTAAGLQAAIDAVGEGGIIEIKGGTYAVPQPSPAAPEGGYHANDKGRSFTIRAAQGATVRLDGEGARTVFRLINSSAANGRPIAFEGLTFANGYSATDNRAGGLTIAKGHATFVNCTFENNRSNAPAAGGGGMVVAEGATVFFISSAFVSNSAKNYGGGLTVASGSRVYVHNSTFFANRTNLAGHAANAAGGAIHVYDATLRVSNSLFEANEAGYVGGAIYALGPWKTPESTPSAHVRIVNSTFVDNYALRAPGAPAGPPTEGGAVHAEDQTTMEIDYSRFVGNAADTGGGVNLYRAIVTLRNSVLQGNVALGRGVGNGFGGAVSAISNDTPSDGGANRRSASLTIADTFFQGRLPGQALLPQIGGCVYASGDGSRMYGENGVAPSGTSAVNRAQVAVTRTGFYECDVEQDSPTNAGGIGGGLAVGLTQLGLTDVIVVNSDALAESGVTQAYGSGGGLAVFDQSSASIATSFLAKNSATKFGGALYVQGSTINASNTGFVANSVPGGGYGSAIFSAPDTGRNVPVGGTIQTSTFSMNTGALAVFDDDRASGPINAIQYLTNQFRPATGTLVYQSALTAAVDAAGLNALTAPRDKGDNNAGVTASSEPVSGKLLALPRMRLGSAAPNDLAAAGDRTPSYLVFAWGGATAASLNGTGIAGNAGADFAPGPGTHSLFVSNSYNAATFTSGVDDASLPAGSLTATPSIVPKGGQAQLSWASPADGFLEAAIDNGVGAFSTATGAASVPVTGPTAFRYLAVTERGATVASQAVAVTSGAPLILSYTADRVLVDPGQAVTLAWSVDTADTVTISGIGAVGLSGTRVVAPLVTTSYTLTATNASGSTTGVVTIQVRDGALGFAAPVVTGPANGQIVSVRGVTFSWTPVGGTGGYGIRIFRRANGQVVFSGSLLGTGSTSTLIALPDGDYTFAVRGCTTDFSAAGCGAWGTVDFGVRLSVPTAAPAITAPAPGAVLTNSTTTYSWSAVSGAVSYEVVITDMTSGTVAMQVTTLAPSTSTAITLPGGSYDMVVRACLSACGPASPTVTFSAQLPPAPAIAPSITSAAFTGNTLTVGWTNVTGADLYQVQVLDPTGGPGGGVLTIASRQTAALNASFPVPPTGPAKNYAVVVRACTGNGCGPYSASIGVTSIATAPSSPQLGFPMSVTTVPGPLAQFAWSRVPGDNGSNTIYRLYVQDLARAAAALDVYTTQNFYGAYFKAEGTRYDALVFASQNGGAWVQGPPVGFIVSGTSSVAPTMVAPAHQSQVPSGNIQLGWSPVPGATLYEYFVAVQGQPNATVRGVTTGLFVQVPLRAGAPTVFSAIVRACPAGNSCAFDSDDGWGPWSVNAGPGVTNFTVTP